MYIYVLIVLVVYSYTVTYPLDITRTRLQIQGEIHTQGKSICGKVYRGMLQTMFGIGKMSLLFGGNALREQHVFDIVSKI